MGRGKSWAVDEDIGLCRAFVAATGENTTDFFGRMYHHFAALAPAGSDAAANKDRWRARTERALKKRLIVVRPTVMLFCKYFSKAVSMGGMNEERAIASAMEDFQSGCHNDPKKDGTHQDNAFKFLHCWHILRHAPMYREVCKGASVVLATTQGHPVTGSPSALLASVGAQALTPGGGPSGVIDASQAASGKKRQRSDAGGPSATPVVGQTNAAGTSQNGLVPDNLAGNSSLPVIGNAGGGLGAAIRDAIGEAVAATESDGQAAKKARQAYGEGALGRIAAVGERLADIAEEFCGVYVFQRSGADTAQSQEFFRLAEERQLLRMRRLVAAEKGAATSAADADALAEAI